MAFFWWLIKLLRASSKLFLILSVQIVIWASVQHKMCQLRSFLVGLLLLFISQGKEKIQTVFNTLFQEQLVV